MCTLDDVYFTHGWHLGEPGAETQFRGIVWHARIRHETEQKRVLVPISIATGSLEYMVMMHAVKVESALGKTLSSDPLNFFSNI